MTYAFPTTVLAKLDAGMPDVPAGAENGPSIRKRQSPVHGTHPTAGPKHRYHFQGFALDRSLPNDALASHETLIAAMTVTYSRAARW